MPTKIISKTDELENLIIKLTIKTNKELKNANVCVDIFYVEDYFNGMEAIIRFEKRRPDFLIKEELELWDSKIAEIAKKRFNINLNLWDYSMRIGFEKSEDGLYILIENNERALKEGFEKIRDFVTWYNNIIKDYDKLRKVHLKKIKRYLSRLESISG